MRILYTITLFVSSALLFLVQPMVAKMILPRFGGSPSVWSASMVFFQGALLLGYGYAHLSTKYLGVKRQAIVHVILLAAAVLMLPITLPHIQTAQNDSAFAVMSTLAIAVGLPFFFVSAGAPLIQKWFAATDDPQAKDPYFLYSASNLGSLMALLAYPLLMEPALKLAEQSYFWSVGYGILCALMVVCGVALWMKGRQPVESKTAVEVPKVITWNERMLWIALAFVPSSLLLGVTSFLTTNVAPIPLLWVVPLGLYLVTFILAFAKRQWISANILGRVLPLLVAPLALVLILESHDPMVLLAIFHLIVFFVAALMCHTRLGDKRPDSAHLTEFYFWISVGGVLGGAFNALLAPVIFNTLLEYPLAIVLACLLRPRMPLKQGVLESRQRQIDYGFPAVLAIITVAIILFVRLLHLPFTPLRTMAMMGLPAILTFFASDRRVRFALSVGAIMLVSSFMHTAVNGTILTSERSFFGVHRVIQVAYNNNGKPDTRNSLVHGTILHGIQDRDLSSLPMTYYYPTGPIGKVMTEFSGPKAKREVALVGLGVGSLAAYGQPGQTMTFYEIDPVVKSIATDPKYFTFLRDSKANVRIVLGDARLSLVNANPNQFGIIVLDAFSSDAIPMHLITVEAAQLYLSKLEPNGILAYHISNRYLNLEPVLTRIADRLGLEAYAFDDTPPFATVDVENGKTASNWVLLVHKRADLGKLGKGPDFSKTDLDPYAPLWTDDYSNILGAWATNSNQ